MQHRDGYVSLEMAHKYLLTLSVNFDDSTASLVYYTELFHGVSKDSIVQPHLRMPAVLHDLFGANSSLF